MKYIWEHYKHTCRRRPEATSREEQAEWKDRHHKVLSPHVFYEREHTANPYTYLPTVMCYETVICK